MCFDKKEGIEQKTKNLQNIKKNLLEISQKRAFPQKSSSRNRPANFAIRPYFYGAPRENQTFPSSPRITFFPHRRISHRRKKNFVDGKLHSIPFPFPFSLSLSLDPPFRSFIFFPSTSHIGTHCHYYVQPFSRRESHFPINEGRSPPKKKGE